MHQEMDGEIELEKGSRRLRELFHAKEIPAAIAETLMIRYNNDYDMVAQEIIRLKEQGEDSDHNDPEPQDNEDDEDLQHIADGLRALPLTARNLHMFNSARRNEVPRDQRQFACVTCEHDWWREVPERKQVSRCRTCKQKYRPVPKDQEWGIAEYYCDHCNHSFRGFGQMGVPAPCYRCRSIILPLRIIPRRQHQRPPGHYRREAHSCCAEDCCNRQEPYVAGTHCVHPSTRRMRGLPTVLVPCDPHESSGSTVASCISQGSLMECRVEDIIREDLRQIPEGSDDDDNDE
ncbi:shiftless antiviral inhibitor of ribosomal frameshifting protein homolog [Amblyraja radiata]|uniref:shiftless antiviral inhibitor of ribosomal frameshifting protein homolog n=1 Tax=Amblyraja radiata TaxID=386614 RepID=UPI001403B6CC|nr:shiftless antiviral inhibitor of ribosomal frameshifting protein homolog [Amblyraja radiata]